MSHASSYVKLVVLIPNPGANVSLCLRCVAGQPDQLGIVKVNGTKHCAVYRLRIHAALQANAQYSLPRYAIVKGIRPQRLHIDKRAELVADDKRPCPAFQRIDGNTRGNQQRGGRASVSETCLVAQPLTSINGGELYFISQTGGGRIEE